MIIAAKCAPVESILQMIEKAGLRAVALYTDSGWLRQITEVAQICRNFLFIMRFLTQQMVMNLTNCGN